MNAAYVLVRDFPGQTDFSPQVFLHCGIGGNVGPKDLQSYDLAGLSIASLINDAHAARAHLERGFVSRWDSRWSRSPVDFENILALRLALDGDLTKPLEM